MFENLSFPTITELNMKEMPLATPLYYAVAGGNTRAVTSLLQLGASSKGRHGDGKQPQAFTRGNQQIVDLLTGDRTVAGS